MMSVVDRPAVVCREIAVADLSAVAALLTKGFALWRDAGFWVRALQRLGGRTAPAGLPQFGYALDMAGQIVGVLLLIASEWTEAGETVRRCNVSSWYVEPEFRVYGTLLVRQALRHRDVTYLNVTPAPETWAILAAQGYTRYGAGRAVVLPLLARRGKRARVVASGALAPGPDLRAAEVELVREHARWDCLTLICETATGRVPFVFGLRRRKGVVPFAYLIYCRGTDSLAEYARALGWALARRGIFLLVADADAKLPDMIGWFENDYPKFFRGKTAPHASDLAYTERAIFGT